MNSPCGIDSRADLILSPLVIRHSSISGEDVVGLIRC
jgi:hypothetical protein